MKKFTYLYYKSAKLVWVAQIRNNGDFNIGTFKTSIR